MPRIDPFSLPRPVREVVTRTFDADGVTLTLSFRRPDAADMNRAAETARRRVTEFITGDAEMGRAAADFFDGIKVSESLFLLCAAAEEMQPPEARVYSDIDLVMLLDRLFTDGPRVAAFIREMMTDWRGTAGNSRGGSTDSPSVEPSGSTTNTPKSRPDATSSSEGSGNSSEFSANTSQASTPVLQSIP